MHSQREVSPTLPSSLTLAPVYVSWRARPQRYLYVGKAKSVKRLNLAAHGKLAYSVKDDAKTLSLIFPAQSREETLKSVEASVLAFVDSHSGTPPELNTKEERVPSGTATSELDKLGNFFVGINRRLLG